MVVSSEDWQQRPEVVAWRAKPRPADWEADLSREDAAMPNEECRLCIEPSPVVQPTDDLPLCQGHWNSWLNYIFSPDLPPCGAHLIRGEK